MLKSLQRFFPLMISMILGINIYHYLDKKYKLTDKISPHIPVKQQWKSCFCFIAILLIIIILGIFEFPDYIYSIICGAIGGIFIELSSALSPKQLR